MVDLPTAGLASARVKTSFLIELCRPFPTGARRAFVRGEARQIARPCNTGLQPSRCVRICKRQVAVARLLSQEFNFPSSDTLERAVSVGYVNGLMAAPSCRGQPGGCGKMRIPEKARMRARSKWRFCRRCDSSRVPSIRMRAYR